ncbi:hypothetical protein T4B_11122 [Trichinella pseudospiralis]|uniref:Uncharacterized protein n=1 Tax=Trichinella pseudospiralis TaxID=6337 RepID=A0A0V1INV2_TRIPS|nr:hypothetical protein T4B_11122 [Trichinella pseudospiralis]KRZ24480.1 hypothetical protein T4C_10104 [Trichinella pseudospiralis]
MARDLYEVEFIKWTEDGWHVLYDESEHSPRRGILLLMAVIQSVMDFRELNAHIESYTAVADVCSEKLREWRSQDVNAALIDLKKANSHHHMPMAFAGDVLQHQAILPDPPGICSIL